MSKSPVMSNVQDVAVLGAGVIGASWAALFLGAGYGVSIFDPAQNTERVVRQYIDAAWPTLDELGFVKSSTPAPLHFHRTAAGAVRNRGEARCGS